MAVRKILTVLALVAATRPAYSEHLSLWGQRDIPDRHSWFLPSETHSIINASDNEVDTKSYKVCKTMECQIIAKEFLVGMNKSVDPCDDFYEFACGAWPDQDPIPSSKTSWSRRMIFQNTAYYRVIEILETKPKSGDILPVRQAKKWYRSCMNTEKLDRRGVKPIVSILTQVGGWPITMDEDEWDTEGYPWQDVERYYSRLTGAYTLYNIVAIPHIQGREFGQIIITEPPNTLSDHLPLSYRNYSGDFYDTYLRLVERVAKSVTKQNGVNVSEERMRKEAKEIVDFEKEIYELKQKSKARCFRSLDEFIDRYDTEVNPDPKATIDWRSMILGLFNMANIKMHERMWYLDYSACEYIKGIGKLLKKTPARTIVNYIHWNFVAKMLPYTTESMRNDLFGLVKQEYGVKERAPRWFECVNEVKKSHAAAYAFVDRYFTKSTESAAREIIKNIQIGMEDQIQKSNWLDEESKEWAKNKLENIQMVVGFPDWYNNKTAFINRYKDLTIGTDYFDNTLSYMRYEAKRPLISIANSLETHDVWSIIDPITINAMYRPGFINTLNIPAANFLPPLFTPQFPNNVNYATAGIIVGHSMSHAFDNRIINYPIPNSPELPHGVLKNYNKRGKCFFDQFVRYFEDYAKPLKSGKKVLSDRQMSMLTRQENIADSTGLQSVFEAYKKVSKKLSWRGDTKLLGLEEFSDNQLFFLSFAAMSCEVDRPEYAAKKDLLQVYSPSRLRVISALSNTKDFAQAFNCPEGSPMNPRGKCSIWKKPGATMKTKAIGGSKKEKQHRWTGQWDS